MSGELIRAVAIIIVAAVLSFVVYGVIAALIIHDKDVRRERVLRFGAVFSNAGFMAFPLIEAI